MLCTCSLANQEDVIKRKMATTENVLQKRLAELKKSGTGTGTVQALQTFVKSYKCLFSWKLP